MQSQELISLLRRDTCDSPMEPSRMAHSSEQQHGSEVERRTHDHDAQPGAAHEGQAGFEQRSRSSYPIGEQAARTAWKFYAGQDRERHC